MKYIACCSVLLFSQFAYACPGMSDIQNFLIKGDVEGIRTAKKCGANLHYKSDIALNIAISKKHKELEQYLRSIGLRENGRFIRTRWMGEYYRLKSLAGTATQYFLKTYKPLRQTTWQKEIKAYLKQTGEHRVSISDTWGNVYQMRPDPKHRAAFPVFCTLGHDAKPGGSGYNRDICSNEELSGLMKDLRKIESF